MGNIDININAGTDATSNNNRMERGGDSTRANGNPYTETRPPTDRSQGRSYTDTEVRASNSPLTQMAPKPVTETGPYAGCVDRRTYSEQDGT